jgi:hypothetical protein
MCQISDRISGNGVDVSDRTFDDGVDLGDRSCFFTKPLVWNSKETNTHK